MEEVYSLKRRRCVIFIQFLRPAETLQALCRGVFFNELVLLLLALIHMIFCMGSGRGLIFWSILRLI